MATINYDRLSRVSLFIGNPFKGIRKFVLIFEDDFIEVKDNKFDKKCEDPYITSQEEINYIINELKAIGIENWDAKYPPKKPSSDQNNWTLQIRYSDKTSNEYVGCDNYPEGFNKLIELFSKYTFVFDFEEE